VTAWHCCLEFFAVTTRLPAEYRLTAADAARILQDDVLTRFKVLDLPQDRRADLFGAAMRMRVTGGRLYDLHIGEVARAAECRCVVTENPRHFAGLEAHGIRVLSCGEALAAIRSA
jgi:hypothetical protein